MKDQSAPQRLLSTCMYTHANMHRAQQQAGVPHQSSESRVSFSPPQAVPPTQVWRPSDESTEEALRVTLEKILPRSMRHIVGCRGIAYRKQRKEAQIHARALTVMGSENSYSSDMDITKSQASGKFLFFLPCQNKNHKTALALTRRQFKCTHQLQIQKCF